MLSALIPCLALLVFSLHQASSALEEYQQIKDFEVGVAFIKPLARYLHDSQKERGFSAGHLSAKGKLFKELLAEQRKESDQSWQALRQALQDLPIELPGLSSSLIQELGSRHSQMTSYRARVNLLSISPAEVLEYYSSMNREILRVVVQIVHSSPDSELTRQLMALQSLMEMTEYGGLERAVVASILAQDVVLPGAQHKLSSLRALQEASSKNFEYYASSEIKNAYARTLASVAVTRAQTISDSVNTLEVGAVSGGGSEEWFRLQSEKLVALSKLETRCVDGVLLLAENELAIQTKILGVETLLGLAAVIFSLVVCLSIIRGVLRPIREIREHIKTMASDARFSRQLTVEGKDEVAEVCLAINEMSRFLEDVIEDIAKVSAALGAGDLRTSPCGDYRGDLSKIKLGLSEALAKLSRVIVEVRSTSTDVDAASRHLELIGNRLSDGVHQQSSACHQVTASLQEASRFTESSAELANEVNLLVNGAEEEAKQGRAKVSKLIDANTELDSIFSQVVKALKSIEDISFQTDILALNAAVEASRAGEQGKGFSVVAKRIQNLATRSSSFVAEVGSLLEESKEARTRGVKLATEASLALNSIVGSVSKVAKYAQDIDESSRQQHEGVSNMHLAMSQISSAAESTQLQSSELQAASEQLSQQSRLLYQRIEYFSLEAGQLSALSFNESHPTSMSVEIESHPALMGGLEDTLLDADTEQPSSPESGREPQY